MRWTARRDWKTLKARVWNGSRRSEVVVSPGALRLLATLALLTSACASTALAQAAPGTDRLHQLSLENVAWTGGSEQPAPESGR
jgi:hypothetical protein